MADKVSLERGRPEQKLALANLVQLYVHDFTDFLGPKRQIDVQDDGRFPDLLDLDRYWSDSDRSVWFILADGKRAGFALLNTITHSGEMTDFNMAEFFVTRPYRGKAVAERAVVQLLEMHPGQWEVAILQRNTPAMRFWPRAVALANISPIDTLTEEGEPRRTLLRFVVNKPESG